jgi:hypothetical protein
MFVNAIETLPDVAVSAVLLYFNWPSGFASRLSACPAPAEAVAGDVLAAAVPVLVAVAAELVSACAEAAAVVAGALVVDDELLEELPQPARATSPTRVTGRNALRESAWRVRLEITIGSSCGWAS